MTYDPDYWEVAHTDEAEFTVSNGHGEIWDTYTSRSFAQEVADNLNANFTGD